MLSVLERLLGTAASPLPSIRVERQGATETVFTLPPTQRPDLPSVIAFALPKSGSTLLDRVLRDLCKSSGATYVSIMGELFRAGLLSADAPGHTSEVFLPGGYCYGGFRDFPSTFEIPILAESKPVLLVRDPRDMLVSHYYSMRDSHAELKPRSDKSRAAVETREMARSLEIDDYVRQITPAYRQFMADYRTRLCEPFDVKIYRYEDVIYRKAEWVADLARHFGWEVGQEITGSIAAKHDTIPEREDVKSHVRQVHPGNFRKKLKPETVEYLDDYLEEEMAFLGYGATTDG